MAAWRYSVLVSDIYTLLTKLNRTAQRSPDRYPRGYGAGQSAQNYWRSKSRVEYQNKFQIATINHGIHRYVVPDKMAGSAGPRQQWKWIEAEEEEEVGWPLHGLRQWVRGRRRWWVQYQRYPTNLKDRNDNLIGDRLVLDPLEKINEEDKDGDDDEWSLSRDGKASSLVDDEDGDADDEDEEEDEEEDQPGRKKVKISSYVWSE